jgi:hypothetical protein
VLDGRWGRTTAIGLCNFWGVQTRPSVSNSFMAAQQADERWSQNPPCRASFHSPL